MINEGLFLREEAELTRIYEQALTRLQRIVRSIKYTDFQRQRAGALLMQVKQTLKNLENANGDWLNRTVARAYRQGMTWTGDAIGTDIRNFNLLNQNAVQAVARDLALQSSLAIKSVADHLSYVFIHSQQAVVAESQIMTTVAGGIIEGAGAKELGKKIAATLQDGAIKRLEGTLLSAEEKLALQQTAEGKVVRILCKDGKYRNYNLRSYGETVARVATRQAATEGTLNSAVDYGMDLVQLSVHSGACEELCAPVQGKVFSISGKTEGFPLLTEEVRPPLHPFCAHALLPVSAEFLQARGIYDKVLEFSASDKSVNSTREYQKLIRGKLAA